MSTRMPLVRARSIRPRTQPLRTFSCSALYRQVIWVSLRPERLGDPGQKGVASVVVDAVDDPPPVGRVVGRNPHEREVVDRRANGPSTFGASPGGVGTAGEVGIESMGATYPVR